MEKKRILIVEDEELTRNLLVEVLKLCDYKIESVENGVEAIKRNAASSYDLIITDYKMPEMNGLELIRRIRIKNPSIPILVVTGDGPEGELLKSGALACIKKPFNISELQRIARAILDERQSSPA